MTEQELNDLLEEEVTKAFKTIYSPEKIEHAGKNAELFLTLPKQVISKLQYRDGYAIFYALQELLQRLSINHNTADMIFQFIENGLKLEIKNLEDLKRVEHPAFDKTKEGLYFKFQQDLYDLERAALDFFKKYLFYEIKDFDLPKQLRVVKEILPKYDSPLALFRYKALLDIQEELEKKISLATEEQTRRAQLGVSEQPEVENINGSNEKNNYNLAHKVQALLYLLKSSGVKTNQRGIKLT